jgi:hypothetical protein
VSDFKHTPERERIAQLVYAEVVYHLGGNAYSLGNAALVADKIMHQPTAPADGREAFEASVLQEYEVSGLKRRQDGRYIERDVQQRWIGWQAAWAAARGGKEGR